MARSKRLGDYHRDFADKLIEQIETGTAPFQKSWKPGERSAPESLRTGEPYRGGNSLRLSVEAARRGYTDPRWGTYHQVAAAGGYVRRGEKGTPIAYYGGLKVVPAKDDQGRPKLTKHGQPFYTRVQTNRNYYKVYNVRTDQVVLPEPGQFPSAGNYYQTALHELGHATGHPDRLNRDTLGKKFGSPDYAREELRAEIAAMMTGERIGLGHQPQNGADYIAGWVKALEDDPREIQRAAADAEKISTYLIEPTRERLEQREQTTPGEPNPDEDREPSQELTPAPAPPAAAAHQQGDSDFNRNIQLAADAALDRLTHNGHDDRPPDTLVRQLQNVRLAAAQNDYTPQSADFRGLRGDLHDHAIRADGLSPDDRKAILALADHFNNQAQGHDLRDLQRLDLERAVADATSRDDGPTRG